MQDTGVWKEALRQKKESSEDERQKQGLSIIAREDALESYHEEGEAHLAVWGPTRGLGLIGSLCLIEREHGCL